MVEDFEEDKNKLRIHDAEFAVLIGGPYDGLKLSRIGRSDKPGAQIGLPTPQHLQTFQEPEDGTELSEGEPFGFIYDIEFIDDEAYKKKTNVSVTKRYSFTGEEVIAVYTASGEKKKYFEVFDTIPKALQNLSLILNVTIFEFDYYASFNDIDCVE